MIYSPLSPVFDNNSRILILGSYPSEKSRAAKFYYAHPKNRFWSVLSNLIGVNFCEMNPKQKTDALLQHYVALSDVVYGCDILSSSDASIKNVVPSNVTEIIKNSKVTHIFLNGKTAYKFFLKYFPEYQKMATCLPSTSPANAAKSLDKLLSDWSVIKESLSLD